MTMKKSERKESYGEIIKLMLEDKNKEAFEKLTCMCGSDTGLFIFCDYRKSVEKFKAAQQAEITE